MVVTEQHLQRLLRDYIAYYNADRVHTPLRDAPERRSVEVRPSLDAKVVGSPRVGVFIIDTLGGKPHDERDSSRRSADDRPWMDIEDQQ